MSQIPNEGGFTAVNPHALATILEASETRSIIAATDIFDIRGIKLWARNQPVSQELQRKLMDRALRQPLETSLIAQDGLSPTKLTQAVQTLIETEGPLTPLINAHAAALQRGAAAIRLHPVVQLLLSAAQTARAVTFGHAIEAMALAGALMKARGGDERLIAQAMTAGLLHDIGEMYIAPEYGEADAAASLDVETYRQLVVHPHIGQLLISQLTDYPKDIVRAIAEHHEHLDGSGYPHRLSGEQISPLGRLLAVVEASLAALRTEGANLHHASMSLRVVPGEFDEHIAGPLSAAARTVAPMTARRSLPQLREDLARLDIVLQTAMNHLDALMSDTASDGLQRAGKLAHYLLHKLRGGWNESGLWSPGSIGAEQAAEAEAAQDALRARLQEIERVARLSAGTLAPEEADVLNQMCTGLLEASA
jgi:HD domain